MQNDHSQEGTRLQVVVHMVLFLLFVDIFHVYDNLLLGSKSFGRRSSTSAFFELTFFAEIPICFYYYYYYYYNHMIGVSLGVTYKRVYVKIGL